MKLIDKDAVVAEIKKLQRRYSKFQPRNICEEGLKEGRLIGYKDALHKLNSLEVKEVDLEKELNKYFITNNLIAADIQFEPVTQMKKCAKHFFELGMVVNNKAQKGE